MSLHACSRESNFIVSVLSIPSRLNELLEEVEYFLLDGPHILFLGLKLYILGKIFVREPKLDKKSILISHFYKII